MDSYQINIFEAALMDIGKKSHPPVFIQQLFNISFQEIWINQCYCIMGIENNNDNGAIHCLSFKESKSKNFPGTDFFSENLLITKYQKNGEEDDFLNGRIIITYHEDINEWTHYLHVWNKDKENRIIEITEDNLKIIV